MFDPSDSVQAVRTLLLKAMDTAGIDRVTVTDDDRERLSQRWGEPTPLFVWEDDDGLHCAVAEADRLAELAAPMFRAAGAPDDVAQAMARDLQATWQASAEAARRAVLAAEQQRDDRRN